MTFEELYSFVESQSKNLDLSKLKDRKEAYVANITGSESGKICAVLSGGRLAVSRELPAGVKPSCTATVSMENVEKMMSGHLNPITALMTGKVKIDGNMASLLIFKDLM